MTIFETLQNAHFNLCIQRNMIGQIMGQSQLHNAITLLNKGYSLEDDINELLSLADRVEDVPDKSNT